MEERLTQRIRDLERVETVQSTDDLSHVVNSIINHLQRVLNTRQGSVSIADDYGMPDFTNYQEFGIMEQAKGIADTIRTMILQYEPRIRAARVIYEPDINDLLSLRFKLQTEILGNARNRNVMVELETIISSEGKARVTK